MPLRWLQDTQPGGVTSTNVLWLSTEQSARTSVSIDRRHERGRTTRRRPPGYRVAPEKLYALKAENERLANDAILSMIAVVGGVVVAIGMGWGSRRLDHDERHRTNPRDRRAALASGPGRVHTACGPSAAESVAAGGARMGTSASRSGSCCRGVSRCLTLTIMELEIATVFDAGTALIVLAATVVLATLVVISPTRRATRVNAGDALRYV